jgi:HSP90 family molecular chaperone
MASKQHRSPRDVTVEQAFDLNIEKVLEHWTIPFAVRELIANALDEEALTGTTEPKIFKDDDGWHVADAGRGVRYEHLTQNENAEKRKHPQVIGQFGMGLKDALAVFDRRGIGVEIRSAHADISTARRPKQSFPDVVTLHALVNRPSSPGRAGTDIVLAGVKDGDVEAAKGFFLRYSGEVLLESTE